MNNKGPNRGLDGRSAILGAVFLSAIALGGCDGAQADTRNGVNATLADASIPDADAGVDSNQVTLSPSLEELRANLEVTANRTNGGISVRLSGPGPVDLLVVSGDTKTPLHFVGGNIYQVVPDSESDTVVIVDQTSGEPVAQVPVFN